MADDANSSMRSPNPKALPENLESYRQTPEFTETTVPAGLLKDHTTKDGVWGLIRVLEGGLRYRVTDPRREALDVQLGPDLAPGIVEPAILHHVEPAGHVRFFVEFHRATFEPTALCRHEELAIRENRLRSEANTTPVRER